MRKHDRRATKPQSFDVAVIGAGPTGLTAALEAARKGARVIVLEKRPPLERRARSQRRFQAVVVDRTTLTNLHNLGIAVAGSPFFEIACATLDHGDPGAQHAVDYHPMPATLAGPTTRRLTPLLLRRRVVAAAAIDEIEQALLERARRETGIELLHEACPAQIRETAEGVTIACSGSRDPIHARVLAVADGARSNERGALQLLGVARRRWGRPLLTGFAQVRSHLRPGTLIVRQVPSDEPVDTLCIALDGRAVVAFSLPRSVQPSSTPLRGLRRLASATSRKLGLTGELLGTPVVVRQQVGASERLVVGKRTFVMGDAAFSGTSVLGVYLNKGVHEAADFATTADAMLAAGVGSSRAAHIRAAFEQRYSTVAYPQLLAQEGIVAGTYGRSWGAPGATTLGRELIALGPRVAFRAKASRHPAWRAALTNGADVLATLTGEASRLSATLGLAPASLGFSVAQRAWTAAYRALHGQAPPLPYRRSSE